MRLPLLQKKTPEFFHHVVRQELTQLGFPEEARIKTEGYGLGIGVGLSRSANEEPVLWVLLEREADGYLLRTSSPFHLNEALVSLDDVRVPSGRVISAADLQNGLRAVKLLSLESVEAIFLLVVDAYKHRKKADYATVLAQVQGPPDEKTLPLLINDVRCTGVVMQAIPLAPGWRFKLKLAHTDAVMMVQFQPIIDVPIPALREGDVVYVSGELAPDLIVAFDVQLIPVA